MPGLCLPSSRGGCAVGVWGECAPRVQRVCMCGLRGWWLARGLGLVCTPRSAGVHVWAAGVVASSRARAREKAHMERCAAAAQPAPLCCAAHWLNPAPPAFSWPPAGGTGYAGCICCGAKVGPCQGTGEWPFHHAGGAGCWCPRACGRRCGRVGCGVWGG
jgi:hypothetical protein